ncbi:hypothetical protein BC832DRAFT_568674 [Gaertneriomyces semiglobifer]|nr:hypothetical protein BC832DRAFT_568674 [Gaertneriomyces semiglobifer]
MNAICVWGGAPCSRDCSPNEVMNNNENKVLRFTNGRTCHVGEALMNCESRRIRQLSSTTSLPRLLQCSALICVCVCVCVLPAVLCAVHVRCVC